MNSSGGGKAEGLPPCARRDPSGMAQAGDNRAPHAATMPAARGQKPHAIPGLVFAGSSSKALCGQMARRGWRCAIPHGRRRRAITGRPVRPHCLLHEVKSRMRSGGRFRRHAFKSASNGRCETSASCALCNWSGSVWQDACGAERPTDGRAAPRPVRCPWVMPARLRRPADGLARLSAWARRCHGPRPVRSCRPGYAAPRSDCRFPDRAASRP